MRLSPPCNANRNRKGPNSKVLIQAQAPWPQAEAWGLSPAGGTGGPDRGHGSVWRALRDKGAESCDDGPAAAGAGICTSGCCIPGPAPQLCRPGSRQHMRQLTHQVSPEQPWPGRGFRSSGTSALHVPVVPQAGSREVGATGGAEPLVHLGEVVTGCHGSDRTSFFADDSSSESCSGNGSSTLNPSTSSSTQGDSAFPEMNGNGTAAPMDFTTSADDQPINLCDKLAPAHVTPSYQSDSCSADGLRSRVKYAVKTTAEVWPALQAAAAGAG